MRRCKPKGNDVQVASPQLEGFQRALYHGSLPSNYQVRSSHVKFSGCMIPSCQFFFLLLGSCQWSEPLGKVFGPKVHGAYYLSDAQIDLWWLGTLTELRVMNMGMFRFSNIVLSGHLTFSNGKHFFVGFGKCTQQGFKWISTRGFKLRWCCAVCPAF